MASNKPLSKQSVSTPSGRISYTDRGTGPVALFVHGLSKTIPGTKRRVEFEGARIFFPEERPEDFNKELRDFWK